MTKNKERFVLNAEENTVVKEITILKNGKQIAGGFVGITNEELLSLYETDAELAVQDKRLSSLLAKLEPQPEPIPTQLDRIETSLANTLEEIRAEARDEYTMSLIENGII